MKLVILMLCIIAAISILCLYETPAPLFFKVVGMIGWIGWIDLMIFQHFWPHEIRKEMKV